MPYIGRHLDRGNYLKLDDISSSFDGVETTFNLTNGGSPFYPGSAFSILVVLAGVIQEAESAYQIDQSQITFASAPLASDSFFCIVLGTALGINVPGNGTVGGTQLTKPFSYDGFFYLNDTTNRVGINSSSPTTALDVQGTVTATEFVGNLLNTSGISTFYNLTVENDLTVNGSFSTLDTIVTEVDKLEVGANNSTVGVAITQSGSGDILRLYDSSTQVVTVADGGNVGIGSQTPQATLDVASTTPVVRFTDTDAGQYTELLNSGSSFYISADRGNGGNGDIIFRSGGTTEKVRITSGGNVGIGTQIPRSTLDIKSPQFDISAVINASTTNQNSGLLLQHDGGEQPGDAGAGIKFAQRWWGNSDNNIVTAGIFGYKKGVSGTFGGGLKIATSDQTANRLATRVTIDDSGNVGIGTDNPQRKLSIKDSGNTFISIENSTNVTSGLIGANSSGLTLISRDTQGGSTEKPIQFITGSTEKVRINSNGNVGIGTDNPTQKLKVYAGSIEVSRFNGEYTGDAVNGQTSVFTHPGSSAGAGSGSAISIVGGTASATTLFFGDTADADIGSISYVHPDNSLRFTTNTEERLRITSGGYVGLGTDTPDGRLHIYSGPTNPTRVIIQGDGSSTAAASLILHSSDESANWRATGTFYYDVQGDVEWFSGRPYGASDAFAIHRKANVDGSTGNSTANSSNSLLLLNSSGNLGINTTSPADTLDVNGNVLPSFDATHDLGSSSKRWNNVYTTDLQLSNEGSSNDVDGSWGRWTIQEGEDDLFLINRRNGKKYKFVLQEVK